MLRKMLFVLAFALALNVAPGWAQSFEVTAFGGIRLGGNFNYDSFRATGGVVSTKVDVANTPNFGVILDVTLNDYTQLELLFDHQRSELTAKNPPPDLQNVPAIDLSIDFYQVGGLYQRPYGAARPFLAVTLGASHLNPKGDFDNRWRFSGAWPWAPNFSLVKASVSGSRAGSWAPLSIMPKCSATYSVASWPGAPIWFRSTFQEVLLLLLNEGLWQMRTYEEGLLRRRTAYIYEDLMRHLEDPGHLQVTTSRPRWHSHDLYGQQPQAGTLSLARLLQYCISETG